MLTENLNFMRSNSFTLENKRMNRLTSNGVSVVVVHVFNFPVPEGKLAHPVDSTPDTPADGEPPRAQRRARRGASQGH